VTVEAIPLRVFTCFAHDGFFCVNYSGASAFSAFEVEFGSFQRGSSSFLSFISLSIRMAENLR